MAVREAVDDRFTLSKCFDHSGLRLAGKANDAAGPRHRNQASAADSNGMAAHDDDVDRAFPSRRQPVHRAEVAGYGDGPPCTVERTCRVRFDLHAAGQNDRHVIEGVAGYRASLPVAHQACTPHLRWMKDHAARSDHANRVSIGFERGVQLTGHEQEIVGVGEDLMRRQSGASKSQKIHMSQRHGKSARSGAPPIAPEIRDCKPGIPISLVHDDDPLSPWLDFRRAEVKKRHGVSTPSRRMRDEIGLCAQPRPSEAGGNRLDRFGEWLQVEAFDLKPFDTNDNDLCLDT